MLEHWVSVDEVAAHLGVAKDSVYRWIETKGLPARKLGRLWKFKLSEIDEWVCASGVHYKAEGPHSIDGTIPSLPNGRRR